MIVIAVVVAVYTAGAAAGMMGAVSTVTGATGAMSLGAAAMTGGTLLGAATGAGALGAALGAGVGIASAAIGAVVGSIVSQGVAMAVGIQDRFNWKSVALSAVSAGVASSVGAAASAAGNWISGATLAPTVARAVIANAVTQGIGVATGLQEQFSWRSVAAAGLASGAGYLMGEALGMQTQAYKTASFADKLAKSTLTGLVAGATAAIARGGRVTVQQVATDAFGNALANAIVDQTTSNSITAATSAPSSGTTSITTDENLEAMAAAPKDFSPTIQTGLGNSVDQLVSKSTSLQNDLKSLKNNEWIIRYGPENDGSSANRSRKEIVIDMKEKNNPELIVQPLAHEAGHALYDYKPDFSSKTAYIIGALADEGAATLSNLKIQREILSNSGPDIQIAGNSANHAAYNKAYDQFLIDGNADMARKAIGAQFGTDEYASVKVNGKNLNYKEYYGSWYDRTFPRKQ